MAAGFVASPVTVPLHWNSFPCLTPVTLPAPSISQSPAAYSSAEKVVSTFSPGLAAWFFSLRLLVQLRTALCPWVTVIRSCPAGTLKKGVLPMSTFSFAVVFVASFSFTPPLRAVRVKSTSPDLPVRKITPFSSIVATVSLPEDHLKSPSCWKVISGLLIFRPRDSLGRDLPRKS